MENKRGVSEKLIKISSDDKLSCSQSNSSFTVNFKKNSDVSSVHKFEILQVICPNVFYNIHSSFDANNTITIREASQGADASFSLPEGQYNFTQLAAALVVGLDSILVATTTTSITLDPITHKITFLFGAAVLIRGSSTIAVPIGLTCEEDTASATSLTMPNILDLGGVREVYVNSREISKNHGMIESDIAITGTIAVISMSETPFGATATYKPDKDKVAYVYKRPSNFSTVSIRVRDKKGNLLPLGNHQITILGRIYHD